MEINKPNSLGLELINVNKNKREEKIKGKFAVQHCPLKLV